MIPLLLLPFWLPWPDWAKTLIWLVGVGVQVFSLLPAMFWAEDHMVAYRRQIAAYEMTKRQLLSGAEIDLPERPVHPWTTAMGMWLLGTLSPVYFGYRRWQEQREVKAARARVKAIRAERELDRLIEASTR